MSGGEICFWMIKKTVKGRSVKKLPNLQMWNFKIQNMCRWDATHKLFFTFSVTDQNFPFYLVKFSTILLGWIPLFLGSIFPLMLSQMFPLIVGSNFPLLYWVKIFPFFYGSNVPLLLSKKILLFVKSKFPLFIGSKFPLFIGSKISPFFGSKILSIY